MSSFIQNSGPTFDYVDAHTGDGIKATSDGTVASADPLDLTALAPGQYDVTGTVDTDTIIITEGAEFVLVYQDVLTLTPSEILELSGGDTITTALDSWGIFRGYAAGVVKCLHWSDSNDYSRQTFDDIYMRDGGNIRESETFGGGFWIGKSSAADTMYLSFANAAKISISQIGLGNNTAILSIDNLSGGTAKTYDFPNYSGTFSLIDGTETLTNKDIDDVDLIGAVNLTGVITPPALTADVDNYAPTGFAGCSVMRISNDSGNYALNGLAGGTDGRTVFVHSVGGSPMTFNALNSSVQTDQFLNQSIIDSAGLSILQYDSADINGGGWRVLSIPTAASLIDVILGYLYAGGVTITTPILEGLPTGSGVASGATPSTLVSRDANANISADNFLAGYTTTATAAGTTTLTVDSTRLQYFTGSTTQICKLPVTSTLVLGMTYEVVNNSSGAVTVNSSGSNAIKVLAAGTSAIFTCILITGTTAASWHAQYTATVFTTGTKMTFPATSATIARTDAANTFTGVQTMTSPALTTPAITGLATGTGVAAAATASTLVARDASGDITTNKLIAGAQVRLKGYTVAGLAALTPVQFDTVGVTDLLAPTYLAAAVGGGAVVGTCVYNGAGWVCG